jgi:Dyp-type peroxidase family
MNNFLSQSEIEATDLKWANIFKCMQGNILKGHGRSHATMIFVKFKGKNVLPIKDALSSFSKLHVTSFYKQLWERERYKRNNVLGDIFGSIFISHKGYEFLEKGKKKLSDEAFKDGMYARAKKLSDNPKKFEGWHNEDTHAMFLVADDDKTKMDKLVIELLQKWEDVFTINHIEYGDAIYNQNGDGLEHNGYVDGISQPLFLKDEIDGYVKNHKVIRDDSPNQGFIFNPIKSTGLVLLPDPFAKGKNTYDSFGSYFVFRKLEQNVQAFKNQEENIGDNLYLNDEVKERAGARLVGRFEDGTPIQIQGEDKLMGSGIFNNFVYDSSKQVEDPSGGKCPHFAHIRKTNPRIDGKFDNHTMARRGIPYGHRNVDTGIPNIHSKQFPTGGVGLLFMSYQQSIVDQFEHIQIKFANVMDPNIADDGVDPVIGQSNRKLYHFPNDGDIKHGATFDQTFDQHVQFKGGEYFFTPSITYLHAL